MTTIADLDKVSSISPVRGTDLRIVAERRATAPLNLTHVADATGQIVFTSENRRDVQRYLAQSK